MKVLVRQGFEEADRDQVADLFWSAFGDKLSVPMGPKTLALRFVAGVLDPRYAIAAYDEGERLLGVAGFKDEDGGLVAGGFRDLADVYGWGGATWRAALLSLLERDPEPGVLTMDGIFVAEEARGLGVGGRLLEAVCHRAAECGCKSVRLDVIDSNPRARALYLRKGFVPQGREHLGPLRHVFGFASSERMVRPVTSSGAA